MPYRPVRRRLSFPEELRDYLLGELRALFKIFALIFLGLFLATSLLVEMYQLLRSFVLFLIVH